MYLDYLDLSSPLCTSTPMYVLAKRLMNHPACNVESRPLNCRNSESTAQLVELTDVVFEIIMRKTSTAHNVSRQAARARCKHA